MKIKIIDLLTKISRGEIPKKIKFKNNIYVFKGDSYYKEFENVRISLRIMTNLNDYVEIIEEPKKIEKLELCMEYDYEEVNDNLEKDMKTLVFKINELIDEINNLKGND